MEKTLSTPKKWLAIVLPFAFGFVFTSIFRSMNAVLATQLEGFGLSESEAGVVNSVYFLSFALFQVPLGVWLDRYHVKNVQAVLFTIAALGAIGFGLSESFWFLCLYRVIIAMGLSGSLMGAFKIVSEWFSAHQIPFVNGMIVTLGSMGTLVSATPVAIYLKHFSFFSLFLWLAILLLILATIIFFLCPLDPGTKSDESFIAQCKDYKVVLKNKKFLCITPIVALTFAIFTMFRSYWINPFMNYVNHLPQDEIISIILYASIAFILGSSTQGIAGSSFSKKEKGVIPLIYCNCWLFIILSICTLFIWIPPIIGWPLLTFTPAWALLIYSVLPSFFPKEYKGRAITAFTFVLFLLIFVGGSLFGYLVDLFSLGISVKHAYQLTWGCFIILQLLAFVWAMSTKKKSYS